MSRAAPLQRAIAAQTVVEWRLTLRRGENLLALIGIPVAVLLFFGSVDVIPVAAGETRMAVLLPGTMALAVVAAGLVNLGIATAYERAYGVLKRIGGSPLGRSGLVVAKVLTVLVIEVAVVLMLVLIAAVVFGWRPGPGASLIAFLVALVLGTATFAGLGMALAGSLRAEATLVVANVLFLASMLLGGVVMPAADLPGPLAMIASWLPAGALADAFRVSLGGSGDLAGPLLITGAWAVAAVVVAVRTFRWE